MPQNTIISTSKKAAPLISQFILQKRKIIHRSKTQLRKKALMKIVMQATTQQCAQMHTMRANKPAVNLASGAAQEFLLKNRTIKFLF